MRRKAFVLLALVGCSGPRRDGSRDSPGPPPSTAPTCEEARHAAVAAWTSQRDRLARATIRAFDEATPASIALIEAYLGYLEALVDALGRRDPATERELSALREEVATLRDQERAHGEGAPTTAAVLAAELRHLAALEAARRVTQRVIRRRKSAELRLAPEGEQARALKQSFEPLADAKMAAARRAAEAHTAWAIAELAARRGGSEPATARSAVDVVGEVAELVAARDALIQAQETCPPGPPPQASSPAPPGPGVRLGRELWRAHVDSSRWVPLEDGGIVEVGEGAGRVVALGGPRGVAAFDPSRGAPRWRVDFVPASEASEGRFRTRLRGSGAPKWARLVSDGRLVFAVDLDGALHALDGRTGDERWHVELAGGVTATPLLVERELIVASRYGELAALSADDGARRLTRLIGGVDAELALHGGQVVVADEDGFVVAVERATGEYAWMTRLSGAHPEAGPVIVGDVVALAGRGGKLDALDAATGAPRWARTLGETPAGLLAFGDALVFVSADGEVAALDAATGAPRWRHAFPYGAGASAAQVVVRNAPVVVGDALLLALSAPPTLALLDLRRGAAIAVQPGPDGASLMTPLRVVEGRAYVFTAQNNLVAFATTPPGG